MPIIATSSIRPALGSTLRLLSIFLSILLYPSSGIVYAQGQPIHAQVHLNSASSFAFGFARVVTGAKTYFIDTAGNYAFDKMFPVEDHTGALGSFSQVLIQNRITHKNKWGIIKDGQWILQPVYDSIDTRFNVWKLLKNGKRTWCDTTGKLLVPLRFSDMGYLDGNFFDVRQNGKWGIYNARTDSVIIPFQYDGFDYCGGCGLSSDYVLARKNGKWGVVGFDNKIRIPFEYDHQHFRMRSDEWVLSLQRKGKQVLINMKTGKVFAEPEYDIHDIWNGLACLAKNKRSGLVTAGGKPVTQFEYDDITWFEDVSNRMPDYACVEKHEKFGLIDTTGAIIIPILHSGLIWAYDDSTFYVNGENAKMLLDRAGNKLLPEYYTDITELEVDGQTPYLFSVSKNDKYGLYNRRSQELTPLIYDDISASSLNGFIVMERDQKKGLFNFQGKEILPPQYDFIFRDFDDTGFLKLKIDLPEGSQEGLATIDGKVLLSPGYSYLEELKGHIWLLRKDSSYFLFDSHTGKKDSLPFNEVYYSGENELLLVRDEKSSKLFDPATGHIVADGYETISPFQGHTAIAQKQGKMGSIDGQGQTVVPFIYTQLSEFRDGLAAAQKDNDKYGFIDSLGREIIPIEYDRPDGFSSVSDYMLGDDILLFKQDPTTGDLLKGLAQKDGKVIASPQYDIIWKDENAPRFLVRQKGKFGVLAADGKVIIPAIYDDILTDNINKFEGVVSLTFPLLCYDGKNWKYVTMSGNTLPFTASSTTLH
jgi:hypothetical protein